MLVCPCGGLIKRFSEYGVFHLWTEIDSQTGCVVFPLCAVWLFVSSLSYFIPSNFEVNITACYLTKLLISHGPSEK